MRAHMRFAGGDGEPSKEARTEAEAVTVVQPVSVTEKDVSLLPVFDSAVRIISSKMQVGIELFLREGTPFSAIFKHRYALFPSCALCSVRLCALDTRISS